MGRILAFNWSSTTSESSPAAQHGAEVRRSAAGATTEPRRPIDPLLEFITVKAVATPLPEIVFAWFMARAIRVVTPFFTEKSLLVKLDMVDRF